MSDRSCGRLQCWTYVREHQWCCLGHIKLGRAWRAKQRALSPNKPIVQRSQVPDDDQRKQPQRSRHRSETRCNTGEFYLCCVAIIRSFIDTVYSAFAISCKEHPRTTRRPLTTSLVPRAEILTRCHCGVRRDITRCWATRAGRSGERPDVRRERSQANALRARTVLILVRKTMAPMPVPTRRKSLSTKTGRDGVRRGSERAIRARTEANARFFSRISCK